MSAGISRQQMVTVCLLDFSTTRSNTFTHTHTQSQASTIQTSTTQRENKFIRFPIPTYDKSRYCIPLACINTQSHTHTQWQKPACINHDISPVSCGWGRNCGWQIDWKIILSLIHHFSQFIVLFLFNLSAGKRQRKPFRPALTIKSARGVLENTTGALAKPPLQRGRGRRIVWLQLKWHLLNLVFLYVQVAARWWCRLDAIVSVGLLDNLMPQWSLEKPKM